MKTISELVQDVGRGTYDTAFAALYPESSTESCRSRYLSLLSMFKEKFGDRPAVIISAPGRTEVGGNHTDHQHGNVLAAAVNLDVICVASPNGGHVIRIKSAGFPMDTVELGGLSVQDAEKGKSVSLIRGLAAWFAERGVTPSGFDACTTSDVLPGSGLSSSAAFEVCVAMAMNRLWNGGKTNVELATAGQYAENRYFGKPCGLMDQMASAVGGFIRIDFANPDNPKILPIHFDIAAHGYHLCIVNTKGDHANLTDEYAAIPAEMGEVARFFGAKYLCGVDEQTLLGNVEELRKNVSDRAILRAMHFFKDTKRVIDMSGALQSGNLDRFLADIIRSGISSFTYLQNVYCIKTPEQQGLSLALALSESILDGRGAWRVHGGGFAGTIQAFVPHDLLEIYRDTINSAFGGDACQVLSIRPSGAIEVKPQEQEVC